MSPGTNAAAIDVEWAFFHGWMASRRNQRGGLSLQDAYIDFMGRQGGQEGHQLATPDAKGGTCCSPVTT